MPTTGWKDSLQVHSYLIGRCTTQPKIEKLSKLFSLRTFLQGALPTKNASFAEPFEEAIVVTDYGQKALSSVRKRNHKASDIALAVLLKFFHHELLVDPEKSDPDSAIKMLVSELSRGILRFPQRFGRKLYDKFNDGPDLGRIEHLDPDKVDQLLADTHQGIYQVGRLVLGPLGILQSSESRFVPPTASLPLWHCADVGCQTLHNVNLFRHDCAPYSLALLLDRALKKEHGPESYWETPLRRIQRGPTRSRGRDYYDILPLIADALTEAERDELFVPLMKSRDASAVREALKTTPEAKKYEKMSPQRLAQALSDGAKFQLLMLLSDEILVSLIDSAVLEQRIKIPPTEVRRAKLHPPKISHFDPSSTLSVLGLRADRDHPALLLSSMIWDEYKNSDQLSELAWRCQIRSETPKAGEAMEYLRNKGAHNAIRDLILASRPVTLAIAKRLTLHLREGDSEESIVDRFLWKFGFRSPQYDKKYERFGSQLQKLREQVITSPQKLTEDDRDAIRSKGVNVFVSLENFLEELGLSIFGC